MSLIPMYGGNHTKWRGSSLSVDLKFLHPVTAMSMVLLLTRKRNGERKIQIPLPQELVEARKITAEYFC